MTLKYLCLSLSVLILVLLNILMDLKNAEERVANHHGTQFIHMDRFRIHKAKAL